MTIVSASPMFKISTIKTGFGPPRIKIAGANTNQNAIKYEVMNNTLIIFANFVVVPFVNHKARRVSTIKATMFWAINNTAPGVVKTERTPKTRKPNKDTEVIKADLDESLINKYPTNPTEIKANRKELLSINGLNVMMTS